MFQEYKEKYCDSPYWEEAFKVAYEVKNQDLSPKEMCVVSFLKAIEYIKSKPIDEEELDGMARKKLISTYDCDDSFYSWSMIDMYKAGFRAKEAMV